MTIWTLFLLALGLSMDAFAVSVTNSMCFAQFTRRQAVAASACFGIFQGLMPLAGYFLGRVFAQWIGAVDHWIAFVLVACWRQHAVGGRAGYTPPQGGRAQCARQGGSSALK